MEFNSERLIPKSSYFDQSNSGNISKEINENEIENQNNNENENEVANVNENENENEEEIPANLIYS